MARYPGFCGPSYTSESKIAAYDRSVNLWCEKNESGTGQSPYTMYQAPGYAVVASGLDSPGRGGISINGASVSGSIQGNLFFVSGSTLYQYPSTPLASGISNGADHPVSMTTNGDVGHQLLIASDSATYCYDTSSHVLTNVGTGHYVGFLDTYGIRLDVARSEISISAQEDFSTWDPLDVAQREDAPDPWLTFIVHHKEIWLFGSETSSIYYNAFSGVSAPTDFPFQPITSAFMPIGIAAPRSVCIVDGSPMWIGQSADGSGIVYQAKGYTPVRISTHAVEYAFSQLGTLSLAEGSTYQENGHTFYELTFPTLGSLLGATWVYDTTEGLWHERGVWDGLEFVEVATRGHLQLSSGQYTFGRTTGTVYRQSQSFLVGTDGLGMTRLRRAPHIASDNNGVIIDNFELKFQPGMGLATGQGSDPLWAMRFSKNGGQTWSNTQTRSAGRIGEYDTRAIWTRLGWGRDRLIEASCSEPVFMPIIDAFIDVRSGAA